MGFRRRFGSLGYKSRRDISSRPGVLVAASILLCGLSLTVMLTGRDLARAEQAASKIRRAQHGLLDAGGHHTCAVLTDGTVRCWGRGLYGELGYGNTKNVGDNETPGSAGPVDLGAGRTARAITVGSDHTCALLDNGTVRCWGDGRSGELGYGNTKTVGDNETPGSVGPVDLGAGRTARAITAGSSHTCALLDNATIRCWGSRRSGRLGYGNTKNVGDNETPGSVGPVDLGAGRTARAITAGNGHTCALLDNATIRCWGTGGEGQLGYGNTRNVGDKSEPSDPNPATRDPGSMGPVSGVGPVDLGAGRTARAITAGGLHTCALLDNGTVLCWGSSIVGELGYGNTKTVGDNETPGSVGPVDLGAGRTARAITVGSDHTCALLDNATIRCWGQGFFGGLGYGNKNNVGDKQTPGSVGPVNLGAGRTARAITAGTGHTCALLDNGTVRCWGDGRYGQLGYGNTLFVGDQPAPTMRSMGPVSGVGPVFLGGHLQARSSKLELLLTTSISRGESIRVGEAFFIRLDVRNLGPDPSHHVAINLPIAGHLQIEEAEPSHGTRYNPRTGNWEVGALDVGTDHEFLELEVHTVSAGKQRIIARVSPNNFPPRKPERETITIRP